MFIMEGMELVDPQKVQELTALLPLPERPPGHLFTYVEVRQHITDRVRSRDWDNKLSIWESLTELGQKLTSLLIPYGGSAREPGVRYGTSWKGSPVGALFRSAWNSLALDGYQSRDFELTIKNYALMVTLLANTRELSAPQMIHEALQTSIRKDSILYKIYCESELLKFYTSRRDRLMFCESY
jgi:hypothetical protein